MQPTESDHALAIDVNHDGRSDLITLSSHIFNCQAFGLSHKIDYSIQSYVANRNGMLQPVQEIAHSTLDLCAGTGSSVSIAGAEDFDGDGNVDVVVADSRGGQMFYAGRGDGTFSANPGSVSGGLFGSVVADLNADRLADGIGRLTSSTIGVALNTTPGFWLNAPASLGPIRSGGSVIGTVSASPQNGFSNTVTLTCSVSHPTIHCSFLPSSLSPGTSSTLTVTTTGNSANQRTKSSHPGWFYAAFLPIGAITFIGIRSSHRKKDFFLIAFGYVTIVAAVFLSSCGGQGPLTPGVTPSGDYTVMVTGSSGSTQRSATVSLTVR